MNLTHAKVSAVADGADPTQVLPSDWNADHAAALPDTGILEQATRVVLPGTDRFSAAGAARLRVIETAQAFRGAYALGSVSIFNGAYLLQYKRATLVDSARASLLGGGELFLFDLAPIGRLVLAGRGGV